MAVSEFKVQVLEKEVVVHHVKQGHTYRFSIIGNTMVGPRRALLEPNPKAKRAARGYLLEAHKAARLAFE